MKRLTFILTAGIWALLLGLASTATAQAPAPDQAAAVETAAAWLTNTHQNEDGGYTAFSSGADQELSDVGGTADALLALRSGGYSVAAPLDFLRQDGNAVATYAAADGGSAGKLILALVAAQRDPRNFADHNLVDILNSHLDEASGQFGVDNAFGQSLAILGLAAAAEPIPDTAVTWLLSQQGEDGAWGDGFGTESNSDATAMAIMALAAAGLSPTDDGLAQALEFIEQAQLADGGWEYGPGFGLSLNSTALVVQALAAVGADFYSSDGNLARSGRSPLDLLLAAQSESGAFQADFGDGPFDDFFTTVQTIPALAGQPFPLPGYRAAAQQAASCLLTLQDPDSGGWETFATSGPNAPGTARALLALTAAGMEPDDAILTLEELAPDYLLTSFGGGIGLMMQAVVAAREDVTDFAGADLTALMAEALIDTGEYDDTSFGPFAHAQAMAGLLAAGLEPDPTAVEWLLANHEDGDWGGGPDANGLTLYVLAQLGMAPPEAIDVLRQSQEADGGWGYGSASPSSSAEVPRGLVAAGENPFAPQWSQVVSGTLTHAADAVLALQGENGCWPNLFGPGEDPYSTTDGIQLLLLAAEIAVTEPETAAAETTPTAEPTAEPTPEPTPEPTAEPAAVEPGAANQAALIIVLEDGLTVERCVDFAEPEITGLELLQRSGLDLALNISGSGAAVCSIEGTGCPADDCFCECSGADCVYWAYWYQQADEWVYAQVGAASYQVSPGQIQAWVWGLGSPTEAPMPPDVTFADVCLTDAAADPEPESETPTVGIEATAVVETPAAQATATPIVETDESGTNWLPYALFGLLVLLLGGGLFYARNK
ncbi:MAG: prenyltransferase/squalene oxidase repeat-containing protein [Chloroflexota bacterium]